MAATALQLAPDLLVPVFPGPAALFDGQGRILLANEAARPLLDALRQGLLPALAAAIDTALDKGGARQERADVPGLRGGAAVPGIGKASRRERVCQSVLTTEVAV